jgi:hypothetical protein
MAICVCTVKDVANIRQTDQKTYTATDEYDIYQCDVYFTVCGGNAYATANHATLSPATLIQNTKRDGKDITVVGACGLKGGQYNLAATPTTDSLYGVGIVSDITSNVITFPLTAEDWSTEMTNGTALNTATDKEPAAMTVTFKQKALGA